MKVLALRFSAMGDVALLAPVLAAVARRYPKVSITLVTRKAFEPFFYNIPGLEVIGIDVDREYRGIRGLFRLFRELRALGPYAAGVDFHGSLRSRVVKTLFRYSGMKFERIVKGRREKAMQVRLRNKVLVPLPHTVERYMATLERIGLSAPVGLGPWIHPDTGSRALAHSYLKKIGRTRKEAFWIGIAPFAGHANKVWPIASMTRLVRLMQERLDAEFFLFGGGPEEEEILNTMREDHERTHVVASNLNLEGELALIMKLDLMVAMDSLNMHLAALLGIPVLSVWGPTHPYSGFGPFGQGDESVVQVSVEDLNCRPCSIFGDRPCSRGDLACMHWITPEMVLARVQQRLGHTDSMESMPQTD